MDAGLAFIILLLKQRVEKAIKDSTAKGLHLVRIKRVRRSAKKKTIVTANSTKRANMLQWYADECISLAFTGASLANQIFQLLVHWVPTDFGPKFRETADLICKENGNFEPSAEKIKSVR